MFRAKYCYPVIFTFCLKLHHLGYDHKSHRLLFLRNCFRHLTWNQTTVCCSKTRHCHKGPKQLGCVNKYTRLFHQIRRIWAVCVCFRWRGSTKWRQRNVALSIPNLGLWDHVHVLSAHYFGWPHRGRKPKPKILFDWGHPEMCGLL